MRAIVLAALVITLSGCTLHAVKPEVHGSPPRTYTTIVIGEIAADDETGEVLLPHFRKGAARWWAENKAFEAVLDAPSPVPASPALVLTGRITEVDRGNQALRLLVGKGAGRSRVGGVFEIKDEAGTTLVTLTGTESFLGGWGVGGLGFVDLVDMEELMRRFGGHVARTAARWSRRAPAE